MKTISSLIGKILFKRKSWSLNCLAKLKMIFNLENRVSRTALDSKVWSECSGKNNLIAALSLLHSFTIYSLFGVETERQISDIEKVALNWNRTKN